MTLVFALAMAGLGVAAIVALVSARTAAATAALACALLAVVGIVAALGGPRPVLDIGTWLGFGRSTLRADGLGGVFLALTGITGAAASLAYLELPAGRRLAGLHALLLAGVAVAIATDNGFLFFLAWEGLTVVILLLASADRERPGSLVAGYLTGGLTKLGGAALLAAFALLYARTGSFELSAWAAAPLSAGTRGVLFALFAIAFGTKVGLLPVQGALPAGYGAAPRAGAASLSVALAAGYYGLWRFLLDVVGPLPTWCGDALLISGAITALAGILYAITQDDMRRFLGYSTVEHAGIACLGLGVALLGQAAHNPTLAAAGLLAATLHVCAHGIAKTLALVTVDRIQVVTGLRGMDGLGGLGRRAPLLGAGLAVASLTLAAVPPLGGFVSEWMTFEALLQGFRMPTLFSRLLCALAAAALALTAGIGLLAFAKLFGFVTLGPERGAGTAPSAQSVAAGARRGTIVRGNAPVGAAPSIFGLAVVGALLGAAAPWEIHVLGSGLQSTLGLDPAHSAINHPLVLGPVFRDFAVLAPTWLYIVLPSFALIALGGALALRRQGARREPVWVTGSGAALPAVQYRPSSYSNPLRVVLRGVLGYRSTLRARDDGRGLLLDTRVVLAVERFVYRPVAAAALALAARVRRTQSGRLSIYLLYMLIMLIVVLALVPLLL